MMFRTWVSSSAVVSSLTSAFVGLVFTGCGDGPVAPLQSVRPALSKLGPLGSLHDEKLAIEINAEISSGELPPNAFVPVTVRSTSGDAGEASLTPGLCEDSSGTEMTHYLCRQISLRLDEGYRVRDVVPLLGELDAQWLSIVRTFAGGRVYVFSGDVSTALGRLSNHPAVARAELINVPHAPDLPRAFLTAVVRTANSASANAGALQIVHGDTVTVSYQQPDGTLLETSSSVVRCTDFLQYC